MRRYVWGVLFFIATGLLLFANRYDMRPEWFAGAAGLFVLGAGNIALGRLRRRRGRDLFANGEVIADARAARITTLMRNGLLAGWVVRFHLNRREYDFFFDVNPQLAEIVMLRRPGRVGCYVAMNQTKHRSITVKAE